MVAGLDDTLKVSEMEWCIPSDDVSYDVIITKVQETLAKLPKPGTTKHGTIHSDFRSLVIPGPNFASKSPPMQHEGNVARFYTTISLVVWVFLRSDYVKTHFPRSYDPNLAAPREVISLAKDYVSGQRKPDIAVMHRPPPDSNLPLKPRWPQIACIGM